MVGERGLRFSLHCFHYLKYPREATVVFPSEHVSFPHRTNSNYPGPFQVWKTVGMGKANTLCFVALAELGAYATRNLSFQQRDSSSISLDS